MIGGQLHQFKNTLLMNITFISEKRILISFPIPTTRNMKLNRLCIETGIMY